MKALILIDEEYRTEEYEQIHKEVMEHLSERNMEVEEIVIGKKDLTFCMGCFGCWIKSPGECVIKDMAERINRSYVNSEVVIYMCPVVFGQFSANIKNAVDRWLPNILPFFKKRQDGSTIHPVRYKNNPRQIMIAYAKELNQEDAKLFTDINKKHRSAVDIIVYRGQTEELRKELTGIPLKRVGAIV